MNDRTMRIGLGLFVAVALVLLGTMVVLFRSLPRLLRSTIPYTVTFEEAPGVAPGTPVRRAGVRIGEVTNVSLDEENGRVRVDLAIDKDHPIRSYEQATLVTSLLGGDATIDFVPKPLAAGEEPDRTPVPAGSELAAATQVTVNALLNRASAVVPATEKTMEDIRNSLKRLERLSPKIDEALKEYTELAKDARKAMPKLLDTNDEAREFVKDIRKELPGLRDAANDVATTARTYTRLGERADNLLQANQDKIGRSIELLNETMARVNNLVSEENVRSVNGILRDVQKASGSFDEIAKNTADVTREGKTTIRRINDSLVRADEVLANVQKATKPLADHGESIVRNLDDVLIRLSRTLTDAGTLIRAVGQSEGTINRLLTDPTLYNRIDETVYLLQKSLPRVEQILKDVEVFADKLARHPELLGVRGAVVPGAGIK